MKPLTLLFLVFFGSFSYGAQGTNGENPYNWIVDNIREIPGRRVHIMKGVLRYGFERSVLLRDINQKNSIIWVSFDRDVLQADRDFRHSWDNFRAINQKIMSQPKEAFYFEITAEVEVRPFPNMDARNGESVEVGYGHMGSCPLGIVVKRIYTMTEIQKTTEPNKSLETTTMADTPAASHPSRQP